MEGPTRTGPSLSFECLHKMSRRPLTKSGREAARALREDVDRTAWFHCLDLGYGVVTPGIKKPDHLEREWVSLRLPELGGKDVLDIGAWDGYFSFRAERSGASRVVALDHYAWAVDWLAQRRFADQIIHMGAPFTPWEDQPEVWRPEELPGKAGFDLAQRRLGSQVESVVADFTTSETEELGRFDVVLFLGVLYHVKDPFATLRRLAASVKPGGLAVVETECVAIPERQDLQLWQFFAGDEHQGDPTTWWIPNAKGLMKMCEAAGFSSVEAVSLPIPDKPGPEPFNGRAIVHARL